MNYIYNFINVNKHQPFVFVIRFPRSVLQEQTNEDEDVKCIGAQFAAKISHGGKFQIEKSKKKLYLL